MEQSMLVLTEGAYCGWMPEDVRSCLAKNVEASALAELLALVSGQTGRLMHEEDSDPWAKYALEEWWDIQYLLLDRVFEIMIAEDLLQTPPERGWVPVIAPFMARYGYQNGSGWWAKTEGLPPSA